MSDAFQVELREVTKAYGAYKAIDRVSLQIAPGEYLVLLGPSGSGKTTLLSMIGGFIQPDAGDVLISGEVVTNLPPAKRASATVFQDYALFPHLNVESNIGFGLSMQNWPRRQRRDRVAEVLEIVGLSGFGSRRVYELSGGQRQRVALARAMAVRPSVLLLDEPLGALDVQIRRQMQDELIAIQKQVGTTFVHVTHDQEEAMTVADTLVVVNGGRIEDAGRPRQVYQRPATRFTAAFMGESNVLDVRVLAATDSEASLEWDGGLLRTADKAIAGQDSHVCIRPEKIRLDLPNGDLCGLGAAKVREVVFQGAYQRVHARSLGPDAKEWLFRVAPERDIAEGEDVDLFVDPKDVVLLQD